MISRKQTKIFTKLIVLSTYLTHGPRPVLAMACGVLAGAYEWCDGAGEICSVSTEKCFETFRLEMTFRGYLLLVSWRLRVREKLFLSSCTCACTYAVLGVDGEECRQLRVQAQGLEMKVKSFLRCLVSWELELRELFKEITCGWIWGYAESLEPGSRRRSRSLCCIPASHGW